MIADRKSRILLPFWPHAGEPGAVAQEVSDGHRGRLRDDLEAAEVLVGRGIQVELAALGQRITAMAMTILVTENYW